MRTTTNKALVSLLPLLFAWSSAHAETCAQTLKLIHELYNNTTNVCASGEPALNCSGLTLRGTTRADPAKGQQWDVWTASPQALKLGASSYSYLRADINFQDLAVYTNNGFIATPGDYLCPGQQPSYAQCSYVADGWTWERSDRGCGDNSATAAREDHCQNLGVTTGPAWVAHFQSKQPPGGVWGADQYRAQCAFDMGKARGKQGRVTAFQAFLDARRMAGPREFLMPTEVLVSNAAEPNILAWIYTKPEGRAEALKNQADYLAKKGEYRPVIRVQLPRFPGEKAQFFCDEQQPGFAGYSKSPGYCKSGVASTPGFGTAPGSAQVSAAQSAAQAAQAAQQAAQAVQAAKAAAQAAQAVQATAQGGQYQQTGSQAAQAAAQAAAFAQSASAAAQSAQSAAQAGQAVQAAQAAAAAQSAAAQAQAQAAVASQAQTEAGYCRQYIASTLWVQRTVPGYPTPIWSLEVTPTECGRRIGPDQTDRMYAELYGKHKDDPRWNEGNNAGTMRRQQVCHLVAARDKPTWNLEPARVYVSHNGSLALPSACNPQPSDAGK